MWMLKKNSSHPRSVRDRWTPWITAEIQWQISTRNLAFTLYIRNPNRTRGDAQWREYVQKRDKKRCAEQNFSHNLPAKKLLSNLRRDDIHNNVKKVSSEEPVDAETLNRFFSEGHLSLTNQTAVPLSQTCNSRDLCSVELPENLGPNAFVFRHTNVREVANSIFEIQTSAAGNDGVFVTFIKLLNPSILPVLADIFNAIIDIKCFPYIWKKAVVTPIPKKAYPTAPITSNFKNARKDPASSSFRTPEWSRTFTYCHQPIWISKTSTSTALSKVTHDIYANLDNGRCTLLVLVDFSLAFNCVKHQAPNIT